VAIFTRYRPGTTPVGIGTAVGTEEEQIVLTDLAQILEKEIGMRSIVVIGNRSSRKVLDWFITPRGYKV
jgi:precorrin-3B methylase